MCTMIYLYLYLDIDNKYNFNHYIFCNYFMNFILRVMIGIIRDYNYYFMFEIYRYAYA